MFEGRCTLKRHLNDDNNDFSKQNSYIYFMTTLKPTDHHVQVKMETLYQYPSAIPSTDLPVVQNITLQNDLKVIKMTPLWVH